MGCEGVHTQKGAAPVRELDGQMCNKRRVPTAVSCKLCQAAISFNFGLSYSNDR